MHCDGEYCLISYLQVTDVESRHTTKKKVLEVLQAEEKEVHAGFAELVPESSKFFEYLQKVFKKKIKRELKRDASGMFGLSCLTGATI